MDRRDFFRRAAPIAAVSVLAPVSLMAMGQKRDAAGRLIVDGERVELSEADMTGGIVIHATSGVAIRDCNFTNPAAPPHPAISIRNA